MHLILCFPLSLDLPNGRFRSGFHTEMLSFLFFLMHATCHAHLIFINFFNFNRVVFNYIHKEFYCEIYEISDKPRVRKGDVVFVVAKLNLRELITERGV
jgi:hypothetical protein